MLNTDGIAMLWFGGTTTTEQLARLCCCVCHRFEDECDDDYTPDSKHMPGMVYVHLVEAVLSYGYIRREVEVHGGDSGNGDGSGKGTNRREPALLGMYDAATHLPHAHSGLSRHLCHASYLAHKIHSLPGKIRGSNGDNRTFESWLTNLVHKSWSYTTLVAFLKAMHEPMQLLVDKLAWGGLMAPVVLPEFEPTEELAHNCPNNGISRGQAVADCPEHIDELKAHLADLEAKVEQEQGECCAAQQDADERADAASHFLLPNRCKDCTIRLTSGRNRQLCGQCKRGDKRIKSCKRRIEAYEAAESKASTAQLEEGEAADSTASAGKSVATG